MAIMMKRQLNDEEKEIILRRHGRICFANGHPIASTDKVHFDHIHAYSRDGETELDNIAPMCEYHNKAKGTLPLADYRMKLQLGDFFKIGDRLTLKDLLKYLKEKSDIKDYGQKITYSINDSKIRIESYNFVQSYDLQLCPLTGWNYFYAILPVNLLDSDDDEEHKLGLQPRYLIFDKVFEMYRHFQYYPVLQPSIGRIFEDKILLFDGQHKAAALLWNHRKNFECKIYINPDVNKLNQANISAHDKFAQTRFFSSIMVLKLGTQFGKDFEDYKNMENENIKTETGFLDYLQTKEATISKKDVNTRFRSYLYNSILEDDTNQWKQLISTSNRSSNEQPITIDMLSKSIFECFLCTDPLNDDLLSENYKRDYETKNVIKLMSMIYDKSLSSWISSAAPNDENQIKLNRIFSSKSIMAWSELLKDAICAKLDILDTDDKAKIFYRELSDEDYNKISSILDRLFGWQIWRSPKGSDIDTIIAGNKSTVKDWFRSKGLTVGFLLGAPI